MSFSKLIKDCKLELLTKSHNKIYELNNKKNKTKNVIYHLQFEINR